MTDERRALASPAAVADALAATGYLATEELSVAVYLAGVLEQPLLLEGLPGVGKTSVAKALAGALETDLIRLQCFEGIDADSALYEWDYARQLLTLRADASLRAPEVYTSEFLLRRPVLRALEAERRAVLLIDEVDRADAQFEAYLLEVLAEHQLTIPQLGTVRARQPPLVVLTSNRTRELHDALRRRCVFHWIDFPDVDLERHIVARLAPEVEPATAARVCGAVARLRERALLKPPGVGETIAWARALATAQLGDRLEPSLGVVLKVREDQELVLDEGLLDGL